MARPYVKHDYSLPDAAQRAPRAPVDTEAEDEAGRAEDNEVASKGRSVRDVASYDMYDALHKSSMSHLAMTPRMVRDPKQRLLVQRRWLTHFTDECEQRLDNPRMSIMLKGFRAMCCSHYAENPTSRDAHPTLQLLTDVLVRTAVYSCQHTHESRMGWPTPLEWARYRLLVSTMMVKIFEPHMVSVVELQTRLQTFQPGRVDPPGLDTEFMERKLPEELRLQLEEERKKAERDIAAGIEGVKIDISEEASGSMWRESPEEICANLPFRAARLIYKVEFDEAQLCRFPPHPEAAVSFTPAAYARAKQWVITKCRMEQPEEATALFRETANRMFWPLGSETQRCRLRSTLSDVTTSLDVLSREIGANLAQYLHDRMLKPMDKLVSGPASEGVAQLFWDAIFLALIEFELVRLGMTWMKDFLVLAPQTPEGRRRMNDELYMEHAREDQRPIIVLLCRRYWLLYRGRLIPCEHSLLHAWLHWLHVMRTDFRSPSGSVDTEEGDDIRTVVAMFLDANSIVVDGA
jgi:hypothetical protein